jgi:hypothetical protein
MRWLTSHYVKGAITISVVDGALLCLWRFAPSVPSWTFWPMELLNLPALPFILLDAIGSHEDYPSSVSAVLILTMYAGWALVSGLVWAFFVGRAFKRRQN